MVLLALGFFSGLLFGSVWTQLTKKINYLAHQKGYHFHHSIIGLFAFILVPFIDDPNKILLVLSFGMGIIIEHAIFHDGFVFVTRDRS